MGKVDLKLSLSKKDALDLIKYSKILGLGKGSILGRWCLKSGLKQLKIGWNISEDGKDFYDALFKPNIYTSDIAFHFIGFRGCLNEFEIYEIQEFSEKTLKEENDKKSK